MIVTRFAPSPTGYLHLGHAYSARYGFDAARAVGGRFLLRIEDIDGTRSRPQLVDAIAEDLAFLGLHWDGPVRRQSLHLPEYAERLAVLDGLGVLYPCFCTRAEIAAEIAASASAPNAPDAGAEHIGPRYPGRCRALAPDEVRRRKEAGQGYALRLHVERAIKEAESRGRWPLSFIDRHAGRVRATPEQLGDVVLARKEIPTSYHLAVTVDDHLQGVTLVTRGEDLFHATHVHRLLQALLDLDEPEYAHHRLLTDAGGQRLAKRHGAESIRSLREAGHPPAAIWARIGLAPIE